MKPAARRLLGGLDANRPITEVLQLGFMDFDSSPPMAVFGALLVAPAPVRPADGGLGIGWRDPHEMPEQPPHFGDGEWQQIPHALDTVFSPWQPLGERR